MNITILEYLYRLLKLLLLLYFNLYVFFDDSERHHKAGNAGTRRCGGQPAARSRN
jgi:hypothetical protein